MPFFFWQSIAQLPYFEALPFAVCRRICHLFIFLILLLRLFLLPYPRIQCYMLSFRLSYTAYYQFLYYLLLDNRLSLNIVYLEYLKTIIILLFLELMDQQFGLDFLMKINHEVFQICLYFQSVPTTVSTTCSAC